MRMKARIIGRPELTRKLREMVPEAEIKVAEAQAAAARDLAEAIRARAPIDSGEYRNSIEAALLSSKPAKKQVGIGQTKDPNAQGIFALYVWRFIEFGTAPHQIRPRKKSKLKFQGKDGDVFPASVTHPGQPADPHVFPTYRGMRKKIRRKIAYALNKAIKKVAK